MDKLIMLTTQSTKKMDKSDPLEEMTSEDISTESQQIHPKQIHMHCLENPRSPKHADSISN